MFGVCFFRVLFKASLASSGPIWVPFWDLKMAQEEIQQEPKSSKDKCVVENKQPKQTLAFRLGVSSLFVSWNGPRRGSAEAQDAI